MDIGERAPGSAPGCPSAFPETRSCSLYEGKLVVRTFVQVSKYHKIQGPPKVLCSRRRAAGGRCSGVRSTWTRRRFRERIFYPNPVVIDHFFTSFGSLQSAIAGARGDDCGQKSH